MNISDIRRLIVKILLDNGFVANIDYTRDDFCIILRQKYYHLKIYSTVFFTKFEIYDKISRKYLTSFDEDNENITKKELLRFLNMNLFFVMD